MSAADPNLHHPAIKIYRDVFRLTPNEGRRREIIDTISPEGDEGLQLWANIVQNWHYWRDGKKVMRNPLAVGQMMQAYEEAIREN